MDGCTSTSRNLTARWSTGRSRPAVRTRSCRRGLRQNDFPIGSELIIDGYRAKNGATTANGTSVKFADGRNFFLGASEGTEGTPK